MSRIAYLVLSIGASLPLLGSCMLFNTTSEVQHTANEPVYTLAGNQWYETSRQEFVDAVLPNTMMECADISCYVDDNHPAVVYLQKWMNELHSRIVATDPKIAAIPRPVPMIARGKDYAAFVEKISLCFAYPVKFADTTADPTSLFTEGGLGIGRGSAVEDHSLCVEKGKDADSVRSAIAYINEVHKPCQLSFDGQSVTIGAACARNKYFDKYAGAAKFSPTFVSNRIVFSSALLQVYDTVEEFLPIVMHELGHYYRGHTIAPDRLFAVFYRQGESNPDKRPSEDPFIKTLVDEYFLLRATKRPDDSVKEKIAQVERKLTENKVGYYTYEQEADDLSAEFMAKLGLDPLQSSKSVLQLLAVLSSKGKQLVDFAQCQAWSQAQWKDAAGVPILVPLGGLSGPYRDLCYRVYNLEREVAAHKYAILKRPDIPSIAWKELVSGL